MERDEVKVITSKRGKMRAEEKRKESTGDRKEESRVEMR
jgi:hypothetical protein